MIYKYSQLKHRMKYSDLKKGDDYNFHFGQLKLQLSEVLFLTKYYTDNALVIYVGAAGGYHIPFLVDMFPNLTFHLWDPLPFAIKQTDRMRIFNRFFTNKDAENYKDMNKKILFMSDIRNPEIRRMKKNSSEDSINKLDQIVYTDMDYQKDWVNIINPIAAYLKFRLPYNIPTYKYMTGTIYLQPYSPQSTECRLLTTDYKTMKKYDCFEFDEKMAYFNQHIRQKSTNKSHKWRKEMDKYGIVSNWDSVYAFVILSMYLRKMKNDKNRDSVPKLFNETVNFISSYDPRSYNKHNKLYRDIKFR